MLTGGCRNEGRSVPGGPWLGRPGQLWLVEEMPTGSFTVGHQHPSQSPRTARPPPCPPWALSSHPDSPQKQLLSEYKLGGSGRRWGLGAGLTAATGQGAPPG